MSSTRASSPASGAGSPMPLTPRSKVKAMLATMDTDSDEDNTVALPNFKTTSPSKISQESTRQSPTVDAIQDGSDEEEESEEEIIRPRGRMAARMHAVEQNDEDDEPEDARARVRKMLASKSEKTKEPSPELGVQNGSSEDEDLPIAPRKHQGRKSRTPTPQPDQGRRESSGLFVSPGSERRSRAGSVASGSDDDLPANLGTNSRFQELVRRKREERKAREAELAKEKAEKARKAKNFSDMIDRDDELDEGDSEAEKRLTQHTKSTRKASKRALEEMKRETQRMSRNMQLAHEARTKKKITKADLFARFNYRQPNANDQTGVRPTSSSSAVHSETETRETTPPTSPSLNVKERSQGSTKNPDTFLEDSEIAHAQNLEDDDGDLLSLEEVLAKTPLKMNKGKGKQLQDIPSSPPILAVSKETRPLSAQKNTPKVPQNDSDSDLEITYAAPRTKSRKKKLDEIFDRVPARQAQESHSLQTLRLLAHLSSPGKNRKGPKASMTNPELQMSLQQRIRQQAARGRAEREQSLRDRGIVVLTAEEREKEMGDVEDLIAKARREEDELTKKEKAEARQKRKENGEVDPLGDSSDDEDWQEDKEVPEEELSGSESENQLDVDDGDASGEDEIDEDAMSEDGEENDGKNQKVSILFDNEASEAESEQELEIELQGDDDIVQNSDQDEEDEVMPTVLGRRRNKNLHIVSDDEDELGSHQVEQTPVAKHFASPMPPKTISPAGPMSVLRSATKTFIPGVTVEGPAGLGLTQIFQGTQDDFQTELHSDTTAVPETSSGGNEQDPMGFLRQMPPSFPAFVSTIEEEYQDIIMDSQPVVSQVPASQPLEEESQPIKLNFSQSQIHGFDSMVDDVYSTQYSEFPEQTQDVGYADRSPILNRFVSQSQIPQSTIDTVLVDPASTALIEQENSPTAKRVGRLRRRVHTPSPEDDINIAGETNDEEDGFDISANAFDVMRKAAKKTRPVVDDFDKKKSKAREMVHEQAEESEDEYAGLGGASDDESGGEDDALVTAMIDDEAGKDADERQLAAFYADKERAQDSKAVEKLYKDITNGMLRRKRGGDFSLSDSEDDESARRNQKRREFARMRKALLEDERIGKIAQNPKQSAFLAAIEDRERDDEIDFLDNYEDSQETFDTQDTQEKDTEMEGVQVPGTQEPDTSMGPPKRKRGDNDSDVENRPPPNLRRTKNGAKRPSNLAEIRQSLSSLIDDPNSILDTEDSDSDLEIVDNEEGDATERRDPFMRRNRDIQVVDRISLKRSSSSNISTSTKLAFAAPATSLYNVKVPPLLRKATSNLSTNSTNSVSGMGAGNSMEGLGGMVKRGGGKKSGIAYQAREDERRKKVEEGEKKREKRKFKGAERRREAVGGLFGKGKFE